MASPEGLRRLAPFRYFGDLTLREMLEQIFQVKVVLAEFSAVVAGGDSYQAGRVHGRGDAGL